MMNLKEQSLKLLRVIALSVFFIGWFSTVKAQQNSLKFSYLTVDDGLSHTDVKEVKQDKLGFIWIATLYGLDRYDGYEIKRFYNTNVPKNYSFKNRIRSMCLDENDRVWLGAEDGIQFFDPQSEKYTNVDNHGHNTGKKAYSRLLAIKGGLLATLADSVFRLFKVNGAVLDDIPLVYPARVSFTDMMVDDNNNVWLSSNSGLWKLDQQHKLIHLPIDSGNIDRKLLKIFRNRKGQLITAEGTTISLTVENIASAKKADAYNLHTQQRCFIPGCSTVHDVVQDKNLDYWVCTDNGLFLLNKDFKIKQSITSQSFPHSINTNYLERLFIDRSECLWICTFGGGLNFCDLNAKQFYTFQRNPDKSNTLSGNHIRSILEESPQIVWLGTNTNGLNQYNYKTKQFVHFNTDTKGVHLKSNEVDAMELDKEGNLWIGNEKGIDIINKQRNRIYTPPGSNQFPLAITSITKDCYGHIWFGSYYNGYGTIIPDENGYFRVSYKGTGSGYQIWGDKKKPEIMVSTINGLQRLVISKTGDVVKRYLYQVSDNPNSLSSNYIFPVQKKTDGAFWVGTIGGGLNYLTLGKNDRYQVKIYDSKYGVFNDVEAMELDDKGNVWMGGNGLERFDPKTNQLTRYDKNDGLQGNSLKVGASYKGSDGRLYFGGINGANYFFPDSIKPNKLPAHPIFTDLIINNQTVRIEQSHALENALPKAIPYINKLVLNYLQDNFKVSFSGMHYANSEKCQYRYKLEGFDKTWKYTSGKNPNAAYTNLDYSDYKLILQATNNDGLWSRDEATLQIEIVAPWWKSALAKVIYSILIFSILIGVYFYQARWYRLKKELALRDVEEKKREEMHIQREELYQQQLQFFTNISHEFRTPLTLILGPLESLIMENASTVYQHTFEIMRRNAKRLINLINELMNFRKVADNVIPLQVTEVNLSEFLEKLYEEFKPLAENHQMDFSLKIGNAKETAYIDIHIVEKILFNLLNNAFKYSPAGGSIVLESFSDIDAYKPLYSTEFKIINKSRAENYTFFKIADTGIGISKDSIEQIFDRYYRISNDHIGSGIGLALVKSLTLLHRGDIYVYSDRNQGTEIIIALPKSCQNYSPGERIHYEPGNSSVSLEELDNSVNLNTSVNMDTIKTEDKPDTLKQHILLVEDNDELRVFLKEVLQKKYFVYEAINGQEGYDIAVDHVPDLIISDVMMPVMNGVEMCGLLKSTFETSHIPLLFLSAKSAIEAMVEGLESGADYYIAKPVSIDVLLLTVNNLFEQKRKLKQRYTQDFYAEATELVHSNQDKQFLEKLIKVIEDNIDKPDLDVDYICNQMFTSRSKLYKKIKSISGQSINEFIRTIRLKKAAYIMTHEDITQNELVERIGILSLSYFQKSFRKEFGKTPSQFIQSVKN